MHILKFAGKFAILNQKDIRFIIVSLFGVFIFAFKRSNLINNLEAKLIYELFNLILSY